jgi:hypothetical protein
MTIRKKLIESLKHSVINGIARANADYEDMSGQWVGDDGVESFVAGYVARDIKTNPVIDAGWVLLELSFGQLFDQIARRPRGNQGILGERKQRFDICVLDHDSRLMGVVEIKRNRVQESWYRDIDRVESVARRLSNERSEAFGCFAAFVQESRGGGNIRDAYQFLKDRCAVMSCSSSPFILRSRYEDFDAVDWRYAILGSIFKP